MSRATRAAAAAAGRGPEGIRFPGQLRAGGGYVPQLNVEFRFPGEPRTYLALVDSGADHTAIPGEFLPTSVPYASLPGPFTGRGVGGEFEFRLCEAEVWFDGWKFADRFTVIKPGVMPEPQALIGRLDFMSKFEVAFDWSSNPGSFLVRRIKR